MKIGICSMDTEKYPLFKEIGFDYIEANLSIVATISDEDFNDYAQKVNDCGVNVETTNGFFPGGFRIVGKDADKEKVRAYVVKALDRAKKLGVRGCVFGSGRQRATGEGEDSAKTYEEFIEICRFMGDEAKKRDIKIIIEPLNTEETDIVNTVADGIKAVKDAGHDGVGVLADFYHVFKTGETLDAIENAGETLCHTHIARANNDRKLPHTEEDKAQCKIWADTLKKAGYDSCISLEGGVPDGDYETELKKVYQVMQVFR